MPRNQGGAIVIEQPNPWAQALQGLGQGAGTIANTLIQKKMEAKRVIQDTLRDVASGKRNLEEMGSQEQEDFFRSAGVWDKPEIQGLVKRARESMGYGAPPGVTNQIPSNATSPQSDIDKFGNKIPDPGPFKMGGGAVDVPQPEPAPPNAKQVMEVVNQQETQKKLGLYELERKASGAQQQLNALFQHQLDIGSMLSLPQQLEMTKKVLKAQGLDPNTDVTISGSAKGGITWSINPEAIKRIQEASMDRSERRQDRRASAYTRFETTAATFNDKRVSHVVRLTTMLDSDTIDPKILALGDDPESAWFKAAVTAMEGEKDPKKRVMIKVDKVNGLIKQFNDNIKQYGRVVQASGDEAKADQEDITNRFPKEIKFEDVSGGLSAEEYKKRKGIVADPGKLISEVRKDYRGSGITSPRPSESSSKSDADNVDRVYKELSGTIVSAFKDNPDLSSEQVKQVVMGNKDQIMAEYGLNEKLFSLLMAMAGKVLG